MRSTDLSTPRIFSSTPEGQIDELRRYLYQLVERLNYRIGAIEDTVDTASNAAKSKVIENPAIAYGNSQFPLADFIIAQGKNSTMSWLRWASGRVELWGIISLEGLAVSEYMQGYYYLTLDPITFPQNLFASAPIIVATAQSGFSLTVVIRSISDSSVSLQINCPMSTGSLSASDKIHFHAFSNQR